MLAEQAANVAVFFHAKSLEHDTGSGFFELAASPLLEVVEKHPENADRVRNMKSCLERGPIASKLSWREPRAATVDEMKTVHDEAYLASLQEASATGKRYGVSTVLSKGGWEKITLAAGAAVEAVDTVLQGDVKQAYCLVRPPGHHASRAAVDGYCFVNNTAVAAERAVRAGHRVAVIDIDVHHGNGTQSIFYDRGDVFTVSIHQYMGAWDEGTAHPETGGVEEVGEGAGRGYNLNVPLDLGSGDKAHVQAFQEIIAPAVAAFAPTFIVCALGVDGSQFDPNGRQALTLSGYFQLTKMIRQLADQHAGGKMVMLQEGGYAMSYAAFCVHAAVEGMLALEEPLLEDPLTGTYPDPPLSDRKGEKISAMIRRLKAGRDAVM